MSASSAPAAVRLALTEDPLAAAVAAPWIGPLVALGSRVSRYVETLGKSRQLIVTISVPQRDFAAALVGCGWAMNSPAPALDSPLEIFRELESNTPVRVVTHAEVITDYFRTLDETKEPPRVRLSGSQWQITGIRAASVLEGELEQPARTPRPNPGKAGRIARVEYTWDTRLAAPTADLAIIGTLKWLYEDLAAFLTRDGDAIAPEVLLEAVRKASGKERSKELSGLGGTLADLLLPESKKCATWFTRLYASARFSDYLPLPRDVRAAILDGAGAIKHVAEIEAPVVICILDRSVADETAAEMVVQLRNSRGEPISLDQDLRWNPPAGIEALAFTVAL